MPGKDQMSIVLYELEGLWDPESVHSPLFGTIDIKYDSLK